MDAAVESTWMYSQRVLNEKSSLERFAISAHIQSY